MVCLSVILARIISRHDHKHSEISPSGPSKDHTGFGVTRGFAGATLPVLMQNSYCIRSARLLDPAAGTETTADLYIENGLVRGNTSPRGANVIDIDGRGFFLAPGLTDLHVHFREPGNDAAETIATGAAAAARGGFVRVVTMPNTSPPVDTADMVRNAIRLADEAGTIHILPAGCLTRGRKGTATADIRAMAAAGAVAFTDDGSTVSDRAVMQEAMLLAHESGKPVFDHALDPTIARNGVVIDGTAAKRLGLPGIPPEAETAIVERDIELAAQTGCHVHIQHLFTAAALLLLGEARKQGVPVSGEATPHHLALCDKDIPGNDANYKMNPPLGRPKDRDALRRAVRDGTVEVFATDHAPHTASRKADGMLSAPFGVIGLETAVGITFNLVKEGTIDRLTWLRGWTTGPAQILGLPAPSLAPGAPANLTLLDLDSEWVVDSGHFASKSRNTPFNGRKLTGRAVLTMVDGMVAWDGRT